MDLERLVARIKLTVEICHGTVYTGKRLSDNPNVCNAACIWFLNTVRKQGAVAAIAGLSIISKETFKVSQKYLVNGPAMAEKTRETVIKARGRLSRNKETDALRYLSEHHNQPDPTSFSTDYYTVGIAVSEAMKFESGVMIYLSGRNSGHVICVCGSVGGVLVYDPNIGVISLPARERGALANIVSLIMGFYAKEVKLSSFAFLPK